MNYDEIRIQQSGLNINIVDLLIFDSVDFFMSRIDFQRQWQQTPDGLFCWINTEQILAFNQYRLQGICNNSRAVRRKIERLIDLHLFDRYPSPSKVLLKRGPEWKKLTKLDISAIMTAPSIEQVKQFFQSEDLKDAEGFFNYNERRGWQSSQGVIAPEIIWHTWARRWSANASRWTSHKTAAPTAKSSPSLPLFLERERFLALGPDLQLKYKETQDLAGNQIYQLKAS